MGVWGWASEDACEVGPKSGSLSGLGLVVEPLSGAGDHERDSVRAWDHLVLSERLGEFN